MGCFFARKHKLSISPMDKVVFPSLFFVLSFSLACAALQNAEPPLVNGISWTFNESTCPKLESMIEKRIKFHLNKNITQTNGLLCLHFRDCFIQGCDAWVVLNGSASGPSEEEAPPNLTLRAKAFEIIDDIRERLDEACRIVSCSHISDLEARDSVSERSVGTMDGVFKGRRFLQQPHKPNLEPPKPQLNRGHAAQHN